MKVVADAWMRSPSSVADCPVDLRSGGRVGATQLARSADNLCSPEAADQEGPAASRVPQAIRAGAIVRARGSAFGRGQGPGKSGGAGPGSDPGLQDVDTVLRGAGPGPGSAGGHAQGA